MAELLGEGGRQKTFFDAPLGHGPCGGATGGRARCADLPPANFLRSPSGTKRQTVVQFFGFRPAASVVFTK